MVQQKCYLSGISYELGEQKDISKLKFFEHDNDLLEILKARGLKCYMESQLSPHDLAKLVAQETLNFSSCQPHDIDCLIIATDSFWDESTYNRSKLNSLMNDLLLVNAYPIALSMMECTSSSVALQIASNFVRCGIANNILVVCTNKVEPGTDDERIIQPGISILSDGAVSCLVTNDPNKGIYEILGAEQKHNSELENLNPEENFDVFVNESIKGFEAAATKLFKKTSTVSDDFKWLITNNYLPHIISMFASKVGFNKEQCFFDNIARFAHAHTADTLINLKDMLDNKKINKNEKILLLSNSPTSWGAVALQKL